MTRRIVFGSRKSQLALAQTQWVIDELKKRHPDIVFEIRTITTTGDRILNTPLSKLAGKGVFVKEIEEALLSGEIDMAVHSLKDLPTEQPEGLIIAGYPHRADPRDVLVSRSGETLDRLAPGSRIGTSSLRRVVQARQLRSDLEIDDIRGNVDTRLRKVEEGQYAATILAAAGLQRLGWLDQATQAFDPEEFLPAPGQGALAVETRENDRKSRNIVASIHRQEHAVAVQAERAFLAALGGGCRVPIAAFAQVLDGILRLTGLVASADGETLLRDRIDGPPDAAAELGHQLAENLKAQGATTLLAAAEQELKG